PPPTLNHTPHPLHHPPHILNHLHTHAALTPTPKARTPPLGEPSILVPNLIPRTSYLLIEVIVLVEGQQAGHTRSCPVVGDMDVGDAAILQAAPAVGQPRRGARDSAAEVGPDRAAVGDDECLIGRPVLR